MAEAGVGGGAGVTGTVDMFTRDTDESDLERTRPVILSASRTRDMVHRSPGVLAAILAGRRRCRWGPYAPEGVVDPRQLHSVVLWTKAPGNLLDHAGLRRILAAYHDQHRIGISLQLTVTGLGGSFVEPGIPHQEEVAATLRRLLDTGWLNPGAVTVRFDPFLALLTPRGHRFGNLDPAVFATVLEPFVDLGVTRVVTSRGDAVRYPRVVERVESLGLHWVPVDDLSAARLCRDLDAWCRNRGVAFSVCCEPPLAQWTRRWGCIDAEHLERWSPRPPPTRWLHNRLGKQRPTCRCTYSKDVGYSAGVARCYSGGFGCLYCYAQGRDRPPHPERLMSEIAEFDRDPAEYLATRRLHPSLWLRDESP